jgi:hypothetical protein
VNGVFLVIFAFFWSTFVVLFDIQIGRNLWNQFAYRNYPTATGEITHSEVTQHRGSKGRTTYGVDIHYRYVVNDQPFEGRRFRYSAESFSDWAWAERAVAGHPVGSQAQVFYCPGNPRDAVLSPGVEGSDLMLVLFLMPFNMFALGLWAWLGGWLRERAFRPVAGGVRIITEGPRTRIRLPEYAAMVWSMAARSWPTGRTRCGRKRSLNGCVNVSAFPKYPPTAPSFLAYPSFCPCSPSMGIVKRGQ